MQTWYMQGDQVFRKLNRVAIVRSNLILDAWLPAIPIQYLLVSVLMLLDLQRRTPMF